MFSAQVKAVLRELANLLTKRVDAEDGGPGSGNWGHKGRPGQVGGSGKGGGNQYRGGKSGVLYTSSKSDWLNGLSGEKQHKASKFMQSMEKLKRPGQSTEAFIMENGATDIGASAVKEYLDLKGEARGWNQYANRLIDEHLDDNDKKIVDALGQKYGLMHKGNAALPNDADTSAWDASDLRTWNDLRSKAMGGPTSGQEAPDELLVAAGLKEAPKAAAIPPKTAAENDRWMDGMPSKDRNQVEKMLSKADISPYYKYRPGQSVDDAETYFIRGARRSGKTRKQLREYLNTKEAALGVNVYKECKAGNPIGNLSADQAKQFASLMDTTLADYNLRTGKNLTFEDEGTKDLVERMLTNTDEWVKDAQGKSKPGAALQRAEAYFNFKAAALGKTDDSQRPISESADTIASSVQASTARMHDIKQARERFSASTPEQRTKAIEQATTPDQLSSALKDAGITSPSAKLDWTDIDFDVAKATAMQYSTVAEQFPFMAGYWDGIQAKTGDFMGSSNMMADGGGISLNPDYFNTANVPHAKEKCERSVETGFHPAGTDYRAVPLHELGHTLDGWLTNMSVKGTYFDYAASKDKDIYKHAFSNRLRNSVCKQLGISDYSSLAKASSQYACYDPAEWFSECFAEAMYSPSPRPMATEMMKQLKTMLKEEGLINA